MSHLLGSESNDDSPTNNLGDNIINSWLKSSMQPQKSGLGYDKTSNLTLNSLKYGPNTTAEDILLEGDIAIEPFLLSPEANLAKQLEEYYDTRLEEISYDQSPLYEKLAKQFKEERDIWKLANMLYSDRIQRTGCPELSFDLGNGTISQETTSDFQLVQYFFSQSGSMSDANVVRSWLEAIAPPFTPVAPRTGGWIATRHSILASQRPAIQQSFNETLVTKLDPDAPTRENKSLEQNDEIYETRLLRSLYEYIRRGRLLEAKALATSSDQAWRAASIQGGLYFRDPQLEPEEETSFDFEYDDDANTIMGDDSSDAPGGNLRRFLWKNTCYMISKNPINPKYERALYAILCGDLDNLLSTCNTWEDHLWAFYNCMMESQIEKFFARCGRSPTSNEIPSPPLVSYNEKEYFTRLEESINPDINERASQVYTQIKKHIILGTFETLLQEISTQLSKESRKLPSNIRKIDFHVVRFLSLMVLYLRSIGYIEDSMDGDAIIQHYISLLAEMGKYRLAILYCSRLPQAQQVETYATLLAGVNGPLETRLECLRAGSMYNLNYDQVLLVAAEKALNSAASKELPLELNDPREFNFSTWCTEKNDNVCLQIRAFEWINHESSFHAEAIVMCNSACRRFLKTGRVWAALQLIEAMPKNFDLPARQTETDEDFHHPSQAIVQAAKEYMNYVILVDAFKRRDVWHNLLLKRPGGSGREAREWEREIKELTQAAEYALHCALNSNWMLNCFPTIDSQQFEENNLRQEAAYLRQLYIPELIISLYEVLMETTDLFPENVLKAFELSELVAGEKLGLYKEVMRRPMRENNLDSTYNYLPALLKRFRKAGLLLLKKQGSGPESTNMFPVPFSY